MLPLMMIKTIIVAVLDCSKPVTLPVTPEGLKVGSPGTDIHFKAVAHGARIQDAPAHFHSTSRAAAGSKNK